jgi:L,D-transpeptidase ErfK/SrfK
VQCFVKPEKLTRGCASGVAAALIAFFAIAGVQVAEATVYTLPTPDTSVVGEDQTVETVYEDTLYDLASKFSLGSEEIIRVNPKVDPWLPGAGKTLVVPGRHILPPGPREGIVVNLPEHRLYYYPKRKRGEPIEVITYPVSIGKMDWRTPLGVTHVISKQKDPTWYPPESVRKEHAAAGDPLPASVPPGPDNPLGAYAMRLAAGKGTYLIHGTNNPIAVGLAVTHGCIRMYPDDVAALYPLIPVGTPVRLINEPIKVAWVDGELLLEAHPPVDAQGQSFEPNLDQFSELLQLAVGDATVAIHWDYAREILQKADGVIATVGLQAENPNLPAREPAAPLANEKAAEPDAKAAEPDAKAAEPAMAREPVEAPAPPPTPEASADAPPKAAPEGRAEAPPETAPATESAPGAATAKQPDSEP